MTDEEYMREALTLAREAAAAGEVPVGCGAIRRCAPGKSRVLTAERYCKAQRRVL